MLYHIHYHRITYLLHLSKTSNGNGISFHFHMHKLTKEEMSANALLNFNFPLANYYGITASVKYESCAHGSWLLRK